MPRDATETPRNDATTALVVLAGPAIVGFGVPIVVALIVGIGERGGGWVAGGMLGLVLGLYASFVGATSLRSGREDRARAAQVRDVPVVTLDRIADSATGSLVMIEGRVAATDDATLQGPLTGRACVLASVGVVVRGPDHRPLDEHTWSSAVAFRLTDDADHAVTIRPDGAELEGRAQRVDQPSRHEGDHRARYDACLAKAGVVLAPGQDASISERVVRVGDPLVVLGVVSRGASDGVVIEGDERDRLIVCSEGIALLTEARTPSEGAWATVIVGVLLVAFGIACTVALALT